jgi:hypothetical protein
MTEFDALRNRIEREVEEKYPGDGNNPGYKGPHYGEWTPGAPGHDSTAGPLPPLRKALVQDDRSYRTQLVLTDGNEEKTYWVDAPLAMSETTKVSSILVGDVIELMEVPHKMGVKQVCLVLPEEKICVPHKLGTLLTHIHLAPRRS